MDKYGAAAGGSLFLCSMLHSLRRSLPIAKRCRPQHVSAWSQNANYTRSSFPLLHRTASRCLSVGHYKKSNDDEDGKKKKKKSRFEQAKELFYEYRYPFMAYYGVAYVTPIIPCYMSLQFFGVDGMELLLWIGVDKLYEGITQWDPAIVNGLIAMEMNELLEWVRFPIVLSTTPRVAKWWRSRNNNNDVVSDKKEGDEERK